MERGRPKKVSGGRQRSLYLTDEEYLLVKQYIKELREGSNDSPLRDLERRLSALEARFSDDKLTLD